MHKAHVRKLTHELHEKESVIKELETRVDNVEQYMRRDCLVISGIPEPTNQTTFENTDQAVIDLAKSKLHVDLTPSDISRAHRVPGGPPRFDAAVRPRAIIVKFTSYNGRIKVYSAKRELKHVVNNKIYINEALTRQRSAVAFRARQLVKQGVIKQTWTIYGKIVFRKNDDYVHSVISDEGLNIHLQI